MTGILGLNIFISDKGHGNMSLTDYKQQGFGINDSYANRFFRQIKSYPEFYWSTIKSRIRFLKSINMSAERIFCPTLGLSDKIAVINEFNARYFEGNGFFWKSPASYDAVITNLIGLPIAFLPADCPVVILFDQRQNVLAQIHSGRENILQNIAGKTARMMKEKFFCKPSDIVAYVSPHLCAKCFVLSYLGFLGNPEYEKIKAAVVEAEGGWSFDMRLAIEIQLGLEGISGVTSGPTTCTLCGKENLFSHRGWSSLHPDHPEIGRFAVISMMTEL